ncbi:MAG: hypothetical protein IJ408_03790 [Clostridia bacterium]|nr:hypothetical protein [Clostridia bacterium]
MKVNFNNIIGKIKPMHAVGQPPMLATNCEYFRYLKDANIPYSRLHDMGIYKLLPMVDISCIFPDMSKDENDPASYDFEYTDLLLTELCKNDCPPVFRLGETIENAIAKGCKPRYVFAPKDPQKWARVCEHIIRHYNEGWADGFELGIVYWEIWNEPDNGFQEPDYTRKDDPCHDLNMMWVGTDEQYYNLYVTAAKHLKACFGDKIKVGGYASSGLYAIFNEPEKYGIDKKYHKFYRERYNMFLRYFYGFLEYVKKENAPLDFFSWHSYSDVDRTVIMGNFVTDTLEKYGFENTEAHLNEWNNAHSAEGRGTSYACAHATAMLLAMQDTKTYMLNFYDSRIGPSVYGGMFDPISYKPFCLYYGFKAFGELYTLGNQCECEIEGEDIYAVAATDGKTKALLIANIGKTVTIETGLDGFEVYLIDENHHIEKVEADSKTLRICENQVLFLKK